MTCPECGHATVNVSPATITARARIPVNPQGWMLCRTPGCGVVYFKDAQILRLDEVDGVPFTKSQAPDRLVCFCFGHSVRAVEVDVRLHGHSEIQGSIQAACRAGRHDCERKNPEGRCCLGHVGQVVRAASAGAAGAAPPPPLPPSRTRWAAGGAVVAALLSSACCWLPLAALSLGVSSAGLGAFFEVWRVPLLLLTLALLALGHFLVWRRPRCAPGEACAVPNHRLQWFNRTLLIAATVFAAVFALIPKMLTEAPQALPETLAAGAVVTYRVEGMSCAGCEAHARERIEALAGVTAVAVSYPERTARVAWATPPDDHALSAALAELGYRIHRLPEAP